MTAYLDTSVLVAALIEDEARHEACFKLLRRRSLAVWSHGLTEVFSVLTGSRLPLRPPPAAAELIEESLLPRLSVVELNTAEVFAGLRLCESRGVRGAAIHDFLHLCAARKAAATTLHTLNERHFSVLARSGDPTIEMPQ